MFRKKKTETGRKFLHGYTFTKLSCKHDSEYYTASNADHLKQFNMQSNKNRINRYCLHI